MSAASPRWLRLTRSGDTITGYDSADGTHWDQVGAASLAGLPATVQAGLFATSPPYMKVSAVLRRDQRADRSQPGHRGLRPRQPAGGAAAGRAVDGPWTGDNVGNQGAFGPQTGQLETFRQAGGRFTVTGSGDIAPDVPGAAGGGPDATIEDHLMGAFAGLIAVVVIAAMFMTAEYRRGLIRVTLAASPGAAGCWRPRPS